MSPLPRSQPSGTPRLDRRAFAGLVAGAGLLAVAACDAGDARLPGPTAAGPTPDPDADPDADRVERAVRDEEDMVARLRATLDRHPALRRRVEPALAVHTAHVDRLTGPDGPGGRPSTPAAPTPASPRVPARQDRALAALAGAEGALVARHTTLALTARSGPLARLLAGLAAAAAQQQLVLTPGGAR